MSNEDDLKSIGLNKYETKAYLCIVKHNVVDAKTICKTEDIPYGKIYETLASLMKKNFVEVQNTHPKKYHAIKPSIAFESYYLDKKRSAEADLAKTKEILDKVGESLSSRNGQVSEEDTLWKVAFRKDIPKMIIECFNNVDKEVNLLVRDPEIDDVLEDMAEDIPILMNKINPLLKRGVKMRILKNKSKSDYFFREAKKHKMDTAGLDIIRETEINLFESFMIFDNETLVIRITNPLKGNETLALVKVWSPTLAKDLNQKFLELWAKAKKIRC